MSTSLKLALVDDHKLFRQGLISLIQMVYPESVFLFECDSGVDLPQRLDPNNLPDIVIMDVNMPKMDGYASVVWLKENHPSIKVLIVSMIEQEDAVMKMIKLGVKGYLCKDVEPHELGEALRAIANKGFYYTDYVTGKLVNSLQAPDTGKAHAQTVKQLNDRELQFLQYACTELTYNEIADKMFLSVKTIDGYRNALFEKFNVKSRVGLVMYAIKHRLVVLDTEV